MGRVNKNLKAKISGPTAPDRGLVEGTSQPAGVQKGQVRVWRKRLVALGLLLSDVLIALLVWGVVAGVLYETWWSGRISEHVFTGIVPSVAVWVVMSALLGLYPGYGLDQAETLRRQTYSVGANLAVVAVFALAFQFGDLLSRLLLGLGFLLLLPLAPLVRYWVSWGMKRLGLWGESVAILGAGETGAQVVRTLR